MQCLLSAAQALNITLTWWLFNFKQEVYQSCLSNCTTPSVDCWGNFIPCVGRHGLARSCCMMWAATGRKKSRISSSSGMNSTNLSRASMSLNSDWLCVTQTAQYNNNTQHHYQWQCHHCWAIVRVHLVHAMNADSAPNSRQLSHQANQLLPLTTTANIYYYYFPTEGRRLSWLGWLATNPDDPLTPVLTGSTVEKLRWSRSMRYR